MGGFIERIDPLLIAVTVLLAMLGAWCIGWRSAKPESSEDPGMKFTDAALALLGLLLAFTFSLSLVRHDQRRAMVIAESNAIGDFFTCASLLEEPQRSRLQGAIREYAQFKLDTVRHLWSEADLEEKIRWAQEMHGRMTALVAEALGKGTPIAVPLTNALNNVTSGHASRLAAYRERLPWIIVVLLLLGALVPSFLMGLQQGKSPRPHFSGTLCFFLLVTLVIYVIFDLNQPSSGTIQVSQEPFERLLQSMK